MITRAINLLAVVVLLALSLMPLTAAASAPVTVTDVNLLSVLSKQGVNPADVRLAESPSAAHPYSSVYINAKDNKAYQVFSSLPIVNHEGQSIQPMWLAGNDYYAATNTFQAIVSDTTATITCINDQSDGRQEGQTLEWNPQVFVGDVEYAPTSSNPTRLQTDPINSVYSWNTLEWNYQVCKRDLRLIEGSIIESWVFTANPGDDVRIIHNQTGFYGLRLGAGADEVTTQEAVLAEMPHIMTIQKQEAIDKMEIGGGKLGGGKIGEPLPIEPEPQPIEQDVEVFYAESFDSATYPLRIGGSATFYPDANPETNTVDGYVYQRDDGSSFSTLRNDPGSGHDDSSTYMLCRLDAWTGSTFSYLYRPVILFNTASLDDSIDLASATVTLSLYVYQKTNQYASWSPSFNIYSSNPTSNTDLVNGDYDIAKFGTTPYSTSKSYTSIATSAYNDFIFNADGLAAINKTGVSKFSLRFGNDVSGSAPTVTAYAAMFLAIYSAENGGSTAPKLVVTYTGDPGVATIAANGVTATSATLNGNITGVIGGNATVRGFVYDTVSHAANPGDVEPSASGYAFYSLMESGNYGTGAYSLATVTALTKGTIHYVRAYCKNSVGRVYGNESSFTTSTTAPMVTTQTATNIALTSARLNGLLNDDGGVSCSMYFQYYAGAGTWTDNQTAPVGSKTSGQYHYADITGLSITTTYQFRVVAVGNGTTYGNSGNFTTKSTIATPAPENILMAIPRVDALAIDLRWSKPAGATEVMVRFKTGEYPSSTSDGTLVCLTTKNAFSHTGLTAGQTIYYSAWGISGNATSSVPLHAIATVTLASSSSDMPAPGAPTDWVRDVQYTNLSDMPGYGIVNDAADAFGIGREFFWMGLGLIICALVFIVAYIFTKGNIITAVLATLVVMAVETPMGLTAGFLVFIWAILTTMTIVMKARA